MSREEFDSAVRKALTRYDVSGIAEEDIVDEIAHYFYYVKCYEKGERKFPSVKDIVNSCASMIFTWY